MDYRQLAVEWEAASTRCRESADEIRSLTDRHTAAMVRGDIGRAIELQAELARKYDEAESERDEFSRLSKRMLREAPGRRRV